MHLIIWTFCKPYDWSIEKLIGEFRAEDHNHTDQELLMMQNFLRNLAEIFMISMLADQKKFVDKRYAKIVPLVDLI